MNQLKVTESQSSVDWSKFNWIRPELKVQFLLSLITDVIRHTLPFSVYVSLSLSLPLYETDDPCPLILALQMPSIHLNRWHEDTTSLILSLSLRDFLYVCPADEKGIATVIISNYLPSPWVN